MGIIKLRFLSAKTNHIQLEIFHFIHFSPLSSEVLMFCVTKPAGTAGVYFKCLLLFFCVLCRSLHIIHLFCCLDH